MDTPHALTGHPLPRPARITPADLAHRPGQRLHPGDTLANVPASVRRVATEILSGLQFLESQPRRDLADRRLRNRYDALRREHAAHPPCSWHLLLRDVEEAVAYGGLRDRRAAAHVAPASSHAAAA